MTRPGQGPSCLLQHGYARSHLALILAEQEADVNRAIALDIQAPDVQPSLAEMHTRSYRPAVRSKIWIEVGRRFAVGDGGIALLAAVEQTGSIREAASKVKWSYRHALAYLDNMEEALRCRVLERVRGGDQRGGTRLTPEGRRFVQRYTSLRHKAHTALERLAATAFIDNP
jgi:molybdate transport system regulatory protein